jgi:hypothetical protein
MPTKKNQPIETTDALEAPEQATLSSPARNVIWTGEGEPVRTLSVGMHPVIELPDEATQRRGFFVEHPGVLIGAHDGYKQFREDKGAK